MRTFDASSMIHAWDNYPIGQFPPLWRWISQCIKKQEFLMPKVAFDQVKKKEPECARWLNDQNIKCIEVSNQIIQESLRIKGLLGIQNDEYRGDGVDEKDIIIIATAFVEGHELVSNENRQNILPKHKAKYTIPTVCSLEQVEVPCISFIELIKESNVIFR